MNNSIVVPNQGPWPIGPYSPDGVAPPGNGQRSYSASNILDFPTPLRIVRQWRWLVLGAVILGSSKKTKVKRIEILRIPGDGKAAEVADERQEADG